MEFHVAVDGKQEGPFTETEVRRLIADRLLLGHHHCWTDGWSEWRLLQDVFVDEFRAIAPPPLASWETLTSRPADEAEALRARLPRRRDQTSSGMFAIVGVVTVLAIGLGAGWLMWGRDRGNAAHPSGASSSPVSQGGLDALAERKFSGSNLEQIAQACLVYAKANGGNLPAYAAQLRPLFGSRFASVMDVPETPEIESSGYVVRMGLHISMPANTPIAFEAATRPDGMRGVVYMNGTVRVLPRGDPDLKRALQR